MKYKKHPDNEFSNPENRPSFKGSASASAIEKAGHEIKENPPAILAKTRKKKGKAQADKQRVAVMLSKARRHSY